MKKLIILLASLLFSFSVESGELIRLPKLPGAEVVNVDSTSVTDGAISGSDLVNPLRIPGSIYISGSVAQLGLNDNTNGTFYVFGSADSTGGKIYISNSADEDGVVNHWEIFADEGFYIYAEDTECLNFDTSGNATFSGTINAESINLAEKPLWSIPIFDVEVSGSDATLAAAADTSLALTEYNLYNTITGDGDATVEELITVQSFSPETTSPDSLIFWMKSTDTTGAYIDLVVKRRENTTHEILFQVTSLQCASNDTWEYMGVALSESFTDNKQYSAILVGNVEDSEVVSVSSLMFK